MIDSKKILSTFNKSYPHLIPKKIYKTDNGYIIFAPRVSKGVDYGNPYYYVSSDFKTINVFSMINRNQLFNAFRTDPIWSA